MRSPAAHGPGMAPRLHLREQLLVDPLGGAAQRQLAQRRQVGGREEMLERPLGLLRDVDLAFLEPLDQIVGREIDQLDGVGAIEDANPAPSRARAHAVICATTSFRLSMCWMLTVV